MSWDQVQEVVLLLLVGLSYQIPGLRLVSFLQGVEHYPRIAGIQHQPTLCQYIYPNILLSLP